MINLGSISSNYHELTVRDVCSLQKSNWLGRIFIKLKFFFLQHKGWVTTKKINQLVNELGKDKKLTKLKTLESCLTDVKVELKSENSKINNLFNLVVNVCEINHLDETEIIATHVENCKQLKEKYLNKTIQLVVGRYAREDPDDEQYDNNYRPQQGTLNLQHIRGKLISVSDKPVYDSGRYCVTIDVIHRDASTAKSNFYMSDSELMRFNPK